MKATFLINGIDMQEGFGMVEVYNAIGIPTVPFTVNQPKRLPRKLKKYNKKNARVNFEMLDINPSIMQQMFGNQINFIK